MELPFREFVAMTREIRRGQHPRFIFRGGYETRIPVFLYHRVGNDEFARHLEHLRGNGYSTLTADEHLDRFGGEENNREVLLTFDDGHESLYTVAYPLLEKFGFRAVAFLSADWIGRPGMISWEQAVEMHESGTIDIQSHSSRHASIFVSTERIGFFTGGHGISPKWKVPWDVPLIRRDGTDRQLGPEDLGMPLYRADSRMSDSLRFFPDPAVDEACRAAFRRDGTDRLSDESTLETAFRSAVEAGRDDRFEREEEQREAIRGELIDSKRIIEKHIPGKTVRHFSYPWNRHGAVAEGLMAECGYVSAFSGLFLGEGTYRPEKQPYRICRVNGDFLQRLPGKGRVSILAILLRKTTRRMTRGRPYW